MNQSATLKRCSYPGHQGPNPLPVSEFSRNRRAPDGYQSRCKACARASRMAAYWADPEKVRAARAAERKAAPEKLWAREAAYRAANPEKIRTWTATYRAANPEKVRAIEAAYRAAHREELSAARMAWRAANPERDAATHADWVARLRAPVFEHYGWVCACCGSTEDLSIDHVRGGGRRHRLELFGRTGESNGMYRWLIAQNFPDGFQTLCLPCNSSKADGEHCRLDHGVTA